MLARINLRDFIRRSWRPGFDPSLEQRHLPGVQRGHPPGASACVHRSQSRAPAIGSPRLPGSTAGPDLPPFQHELRRVQSQPRLLFQPAVARIAFLLQQRFDLRRVVHRSGPGSRNGGKQSENENETSWVHCGTPNTGGVLNLRLDEGQTRSPARICRQRSSSGFRIPTICRASTCHPATRRRPCARPRGSREAHPG